MFFIHKKTGALISLSDHEKNVLSQKDNFTNYEYDNTIVKLRSFKNDYWLTCFCNPKAILIICSLKSNLYIRCKTLQQHSKNCRFAKNKIILTQKRYKNNSFKRIKRYDLYKHIQSLSTNNSNLNENNSKLKSISSLGQILYTIIDESKVNIVNYHSPISILKQLTQITNAFQDPQKFITKGIPLAKYYRYSLQDVTLRKAQLMLQQAIRIFPKNLYPFMLFTTLASEISANHFITKKHNQTYFVDNIISTTSTWINKTISAPYFLLAAAVLNSNNEIFFKDAFAIPVVSNALLMPIESNYERNVYNILSHHCSPYSFIQIEKPLFDLLTEDKQRFRPDFIVHIHNTHKIFVEVLGSNNPGYLNHKEQIRSLSRNHCDKYISIKAFESAREYDRFKYQLQQTLNHFI